MSPHPYRLAGSRTRRTRGFTRARNLPRAVARPARMHSSEAEARTGASQRIIKTDRDGMFEVLPAFRLTGILTPGCMAEYLVEGRIVRRREVEPSKAETPTRFSPTLFQNPVCVKAVDVVELALQRITENVVRLGDPFEVLFCMPVTRVDIRMKPAGQLSKSSLDLIYRGASIHLENDIKIFSA